MRRNIFRLFSSLMAVFMLAVVSVPSAYAATEGAETFYQVMSPLYFAWTKYQEWKESHPNEPDSAYTGFIPGGTFGGGAGRHEVEQKYNDYVSTLPTSGFNSAGSLIWRPSTNDVTRVCYYGVTESGKYFDADKLPVFITPLDNGMGYFIKGKFGSSSTVGSYIGQRGIAFRCEFKLPVTGEYKRLASTLAVGEVFIFESRNDELVEISVPCYEDYEPAVRSSSRQAGSLAWSYMQRYFENATLSNSLSRFSYNWYFPVYEITIPSDLSDTYGEYYNITSRPTSITGGNYGIVGDNGQITKVENNSTIVNETNNTYYNPATGQTQPITNWAYDYSDRSYTLTLEGGKTSTVTYGDEYITIQEGDTVYNVYYVVDGSGSENPPTACTHDWRETSTNPATCTASGSKVLTCSKCQQTKAETLPALGHNWQETKSTPATCTVPGSKVRTCSRCQQTETETLSALGHDWQVKQTVTTQYDDSGQLTQQGYTIFECSRCHEQYKSTDGVVPPGGSGTDPGGEDDTTIGGLIEKLLSGLGGVLSGIIKGLLALLTQAVEAISGIGELFTSFVGSLVGLWGGFTDFLAAVFPFLPAEFITIVELGLILMIAVAVFKKFVS